MNKRILLCLATLLSVSAFASAQTHVDFNTSVGIQVGNTKPGYPAQQYPQGPLNYPQYPNQPNHRPHPGQPLPPLIHRPPNGKVNGGLNIQYQAPSYTTINQQSYTWVNGDPNVAQIKTTDRIYITNWRELGLPAPPNGMRWIFENGRYILEAN